MLNRQVILYISNSYQKVLLSIDTGFFTASLFLLIDYFRVRFPTTDALKIIREVLQLKADYMLYEDFGKYG